MSERFDWKIDGSNSTFGERLEHYKNSFGYYDLPISQRIALEQTLWNLAAEEVLTEIHSMLRYLCESK